MTDARRLSARLREAANETRRALDTEPWPPSREEVEEYHALLSDAARLAEAVEELQYAKTNTYWLTDHNSARVNAALSALLAFDLIGRGGVDD